MVLDYYKILEVNKSSSTADIKKAYRRLALKWHPDKNPDNLDEANRRFKEISEAYEILSDDKKRRMYDQYGSEGLRHGGMGGGRRHHFDENMDFFSFPFTFRDPEDVFREFFGGSSPFSSFFGGRRGGGRHDSLSNMFSPLGGLTAFDEIFSGLDGSNGQVFTSFSSYGGGHTQPVSKRTVTSTRFSGGKKITTKKVIENGKETVLQYENDVLKSKTVNGVTQALSYS